MKVDLELGGTDQTFNMLAGRTLVKSFLNKEKFVMSVPLLTDSKGVKIGKSEGNVIALTDKPIDFYAKIMALGDDAIVNCFTLLTDRSVSEIKEIGREINKGSAMKYKKQLAFDLTTWLNSKKDAEDAQENFEKTFQKREPEYGDTVENKNNLIDTLESILGSKSEAKRLIKQVGVDINGEKITDVNFELKQGDKINLGKRRFLKVK